MESETTFETFVVQEMLQMASAVRRIVKIPTIVALPKITESKLVTHQK
jgi:hypothetical protein